MTVATSRRRVTFVSPECTDFDLGVVAYKTGKRLADCTSDEQRRGWLKAQWTREDAYWACMIAQASDEEPDYPIEADYAWIARGC